jgi:hypothetical protein
VKLFNILHALILPFRVFTGRQVTLAQGHFLPSRSHGDSIPRPYLVTGVYSGGPMIPDRHSPDWDVYTLTGGIPAHGY